MREGVGGGWGMIKRGSGGWMGNDKKAQKMWPLNSIRDC